MAYRRFFKPVIPNIIHFVFGERTFSFVHYLAVVTAQEVNHPECIYFHYGCEPSGPWWDRAKPYLTLHRIAAPNQIFGNVLDHFAHKADVIRLEQLMQHGGIYLDMDVICVTSLRPLRENECVMARQPDGGLGNAVIMALPGAPFIAKWYNQYRDFDPKLWDEHSVRRPLLIANRHPALITIIASSAFFFPFYSDPPHILWMPQRSALQMPEVKAVLIRRIKRHTWKLARLKRVKALYPPLENFIKTKNSHFKKLTRCYCIHLWEQAWWETYLSRLSPAYISRSETNFARLVRRVLADTDSLRELQELADKSI